MNARVIDAATGRPVARMSFGNRVDVSAVVAIGDRLLVGQRNAIAVVDTIAHQIRATWTVGRDMAALAADVERNRVFAGGDGNVLVLDAATGAQVGRLDVECCVRALAFDEDTRLLIVSSNTGGDGRPGSVLIARSDAGGLSPVQLIGVDPGATVRLLDPASHAVVMAAPDLPADTRGPQVPSDRLLFLAYERAAVWFR